MFHILLFVTLFCAYFLFICFVLILYIFPVVLHTLSFCILYSFHSLSLSLSLASSYLEITASDIQHYNEGERKTATQILQPPNKCSTHKKKKTRCKFICWCVQIAGAHSLQHLISSLVGIVYCCGVCVVSCEFVKTVPF